MFRSKFGFILWALVLAVAVAAAGSIHAYPQHEQYWTGRVMNAQGSFRKLGPEVMFGRGADPAFPAEAKWQGWLKFDLSGLPDNAEIKSVSLFYNVISPGNGPVPATYVTIVEVDPVFAAAEELWQAIVEGQIAASALSSSRGWVERALDEVGREAVQAGLVRDWVAFGLYEFEPGNHKGYAHVKGYQAEKFRPYLRISYQAADVAVEDIFGPEGELPADTVVVPVVVIVNEGSLDASAEVTVVISDSAGSVYEETVEVPTVPAGGEQSVALPEWFPAAGEFTVVVNVEVEGDANVSNNQSVSWVVVVPELPPSPISSPRHGWESVKPVPVGHSAEEVRQGGWLAVDKGSGLVYAARGAKSRQFSVYDPRKGSWSALSPLPVKAGRGARGVADGRGNVFFVRGGGTREFWRYVVAENRWEKLPDVPYGNSGKGVKAFADMVHVSRYGLDFIYLLRGPQQDFARYNVQARSWAMLADAPAGAAPAWKQGSWLVYDGESKIYAHKAPVHEMWIYDLEEESWVGQVPAMPYAREGSNSRPRRLKEGGSAAWSEDGIYALKAGNTQEFWRYEVKGAVWKEAEPMPAVGTNLKRKMAGPGADLVTYPFSRALYAFKGNRTFEFWRYTLPPRRSNVAGRTDLVRAKEIPSARKLATVAVAVRPNPVAGRRASLHFSAPVAGNIQLVLFDALGRVHLQSVVQAERNMLHAPLELGNIPAGVYVLQAELEGSIIGSQFLVID